MVNRAPSKQAKATMGTSALREAQLPPPPPPPTTETEDMFTEVGPSAEEPAAELGDCDLRAPPSPSIARWPFVRRCRERPSERERVFVCVCWDN